jgi:transcription antitermination factor NusG
LREQTARRFLELAKFTVYIPRVRERQTKGGRRIERLRPLFPSYAFIAFRDGRWWDARWCVGVAAVIMSGGELARLSDHTVDEIRSRERGGAVELPRRLGFKSGDQVRVLAGPLQGQFGLYQGHQRPHEIGGHSTSPRVGKSAGRKNSDAAIGSSPNSVVIYR